MYSLPTTLAALILDDAVHGLPIYKASEDLQHDAHVKEYKECKLDGRYKNWRNSHIRRKDLGLTLKLLSKFIKNCHDLPVSDQIRTAVQTQFDKASQTLSPGQSAETISKIEIPLPEVNQSVTITGWFTRDADGNVYLTSSPKTSDLLRFQTVRTTKMRFREIFGL